MAIYIPKRGARVHVQGRDGVFIVLRVHIKKRLVDLQWIGKSPSATKDVPLGLIRPVYGSEDLN